MLSRARSRDLALFLFLGFLLCFPLGKLSLPLLRFKVSHDIRQKASGYLLADVFRYLWQMTLSARITEDEFYSQKEAFDPTGVKIFLSEKPCSEDFLFFSLPFRFFLTLLTLYFFPILDILSVKKNGTLDTLKGEKSGRSSCPNHLTISGFFPIRLHSVGVIP